MATKRKNISSLSAEQQETYKNAIRKGYFDAYDADTTAWRHSFLGAYIWKHPNRVCIMRFIEKNMGIIPTWDDITDLFLMELKEKLTEKYSANSCRTIFAEIKAIVNEYQNTFPVPSKRYDKILSIRKEPSQSVYLTQEEIYAIHCYAPRTPIEREVKRVFMVECLTGARHEDAKAMRMANLDASTKMVRYISTKTKSEVSLPIHHWLRRYLAAADTEQFLPFPTVAVANQILRLICQRVHINAETTLFRRGASETGPKYQFVSTHTGRRSFATNLFIAGCDPYSIARFMGHANPNTTIENYIIGYRPVPQEAYVFFNYHSPNS